MDFGLTLFEMVVIFSTMVIAYIIFGITGFGSALIASPILALFIPVAKIVPLLAIVDMFAAITNVARHSRHADLAEFMPSAGVNHKGNSNLLQPFLLA